MKDINIEEELLTQRFLAVQQLQDIHPLRDKPDLECESCHGSGISIENRDPYGKWDWWVIGGRWAKVFEQRPMTVILE